MGSLNWYSESEWSAEPSCTPLSQTCDSMAVDKGAGACEKEKGVSVGETEEMGIRRGSE